MLNAVIAIVEAVNISDKIFQVLNELQALDALRVDQENSTKLPFWVQLTTAVKNENAKSLRRLMSSEKDFFSGGGGETRDEWLKFMKVQNLL